MRNARSTFRSKAATTIALGMVAGLVTALGTPPAAAALAPGCSSGPGAAVTCTRTFLASGGGQTFTVPAGVSTVSVVAIGGTGEAACDGAVGGVGARVGAALPVAPGTTLSLTFGGGGSAASCSGDGGDASTLSRDGSALVVAGGGGGGGKAQGVATGADGGAAAGWSGDDGGKAAAFWSGFLHLEDVPGGIGATPTGGPGGSGTGESQQPDQFGGGGGAGYYGGGAGPGGRSTWWGKDSGGSGGGAGSSYVTPTGSSPTAGANSGRLPQQIRLSFTVAAPVATIAAPTDGGTYGLGESVPTSFSCDTVPSGGPVICVDSAGRTGGSGFLDTATAGSHTYTVTATNEVGGMATRTLSYTVTKGVPTITWATPDPIVYGTLAGTDVHNATASVPGTFTYPALDALLEAGTHTVTATFTPTDTANYVSTTASVDLTVLPAPLTVTASDGTHVYGSPAPEITAGYAGFVNDEGPEDLDVLAACTSSSDATSAAGTYASRCAGAEGRNYAITFLDGEVTVTPAPLTVTAADGAHDYGTPPPAITPSYAGFVNGDGPGGLDLAPLCASTSDETSDAGSYPSLCSGGADQNYTFTYVAGEVIVTKAPIAVTGDRVALVRSFFIDNTMIFRTHVRSAITGAPVAGAQVEVSIRNIFGNTYRCIATTDELGDAECTNGNVGAVFRIFGVPDHYDIAVGEVDNYLGGNGTGEVRVTDHGDW